MIILILLAVFRCGSDRFYLKRAAGLEADGKDMLYYFRFGHFVRMIIFYANYITRKLFILIASFSPFILAVSTGAWLIYSGRMSVTFFTVLSITAVVLFVHGLVFFIRFNAFFFVARYCFVSGRFDSVRDLFRFCYNCMNNNRGRVLRMRLNFVPWFFSCILLMPVSFVRSYYNQTMAQLAADLIQKHLQKR